MAKTAKQELLDLYNAKNPDLLRPVTFDDVDMNPPEEQPESEENGWRNTTVQLYALDNGTFQNSVDLSYKRLNTNFNGDEVIDELENWDDDAYVLADMNRRLQVTYPGEEFTADELMIGRNPQEDGTLQVLVGWHDHYKWLPPQNENHIYIFHITPPKTDLSTAQGELEGFK